MKLNKQAAVAEFLGTAFLVAAVVGSGIMGQRLSNGNIAVTLLANSLATGAMLFALILTLAPVSGAHFNPIVTLALARQNKMSGTVVVRYCGMQVLGALVGTVSANVMFQLPPIMVSHNSRTGVAQFFSEFIATFGLLSIILIGARFRESAVAYTVAAYITAGYWFTSSTAFANPAVTIARAFTDTFSGIRPIDVPLFIVSQIAGAIAAYRVSIWMLEDRFQKDRGVKVKKESA